MPLNTSFKQRIPGLRQNTLLSLKMAKQMHLEYLTGPGKGFWNLKILGSVYLNTHRLYRSQNDVTIGMMLKDLCQKKIIFGHVFGVSSTLSVDIGCDRLSPCIEIIQFKITREYGKKWSSFFY